MNLFQLVFKQMRQRALGTWLTLLSVVLGVALAVSIFLMRQAGTALFGQTEFGYDVLVGIGQGSPLSLTLNTVYHLDKSPGNIPYWAYESLDTQDRPRSNEFKFNEHVRTAVPIAVGDTYKGRAIVGTPPKMFVSLQGLRDRIEQIDGEQRQLRNDLNDGWNDQFPARQMKLQAALQRLRDEVRQVTRQTTPLIEQPGAPPVPQSGNGTWRYGRPISFVADWMLTEAAAATAALAAKDTGGATKHQQAVLDALEAVKRSAGAENGPLNYRPDMSYELAQGRVFHAWKFEAVIGSEVAEKTGLSIGTKFHATHGNPGPNEKPDEHAELWEIVGVMKPTHTAGDRCLYIPLLTFYSIAEHEKGLAEHESAREGKSSAAAKAEDDTPKFKLVYGDELHPDLPHEQQYMSLDVPKSEWEISAVLVKSRGPIKGDQLMYFISNGGMHENIQAVNPARVMRQFFDTFFASSTTVLLVIAALVSVVAAIGILVSIYNSVSARNREIAILRALGATRGRVLTLICVEAGLIGLFGAILGLIAGHLLGGIGSYYMSRELGQGFNWVATNLWEWVYLIGVVIIALVAGLVPAAKAYTTPVATNLVSG